MSVNKFEWTRRRLLGSASAALGQGLVPGLVSALIPVLDPAPLRALLPAAAAPLATGASAAPFSRFTDIAKEAGLTQPMIYGDPLHLTYVIETMGGGCAFIDYDNDGWMDIFLLCGRRLEGVPTGATNRLYRNNRNGTFTDVTEKAGLARSGWANGVCVGDYNNDGFEDLFLTYTGQNVLYRNNGDGTFTDVTEKAGLQHPKTRFCAGCTFVDTNRDGFLDLFVANYVEWDLDHAPKPSLQELNCNYEGVPVNCMPRAFTPPGHALYRNNGDGTFRDVSKESGVADLRGSYGLSVVSFDADEDGWQDIFIACDSSPSLLLLNNHDGTFREEGTARGVAVSPEGEEIGGMGTYVGDYNLDGHLDLLKTHFINQATGLYQGNGKGEFEDVARRAGLAQERRFICWGVGFADFDNDGNPDILVVDGTVYPELEAVYPKYPARGPRLLFRSQGNGRFVAMGDEAGPGISAAHVSRGCAFGDFDNDGDIDVLILNHNEPPSLLRNDAPPGNHWIKVRLEGTKSNRSAIGARVVAHYGGKMQVQSVTSQTSYLSASDPRLHFGLGAATVADFEIYWPSGGKEAYTNLAADQLVLIREGHGVVRDGHGVLKPALEGRLQGTPHA